MYNYKAYDYIVVKGGLDYLNAVSNGLYYVERLNARLFDSDLDSLPDRFEVTYTNFNPCIAHSTSNEYLNKDPDGDGLENGEELFYGTNPYVTNALPFDPAFGVLDHVRFGVYISHWSGYDDIIMKLSTSNQTYTILSAYSGFDACCLTKTNELIDIVILRNTSDTNNICSSAEADYTITPRDSWVVPCYIPKSSETTTMMQMSIDNSVNIKDEDASKAEYDKTSSPSDELPYDVLFLYPTFNFSAGWSSEDGYGCVLPCDPGVSASINGYVTLVTDNISVPAGAIIGEVRTGLEQYSFNIYDNNENLIDGGNVSFGGESEYVYLPKTYSSVFADVSLSFYDVGESIDVVLLNSDLGTQTNSLIYPEISIGVHDRSINVYGTLLNMTNDNSEQIDINLEGTHCYTNTSITLSALENPEKISTYYSLPYTWSDLDGCGGSLSMEVSAGNSCSLQIGDVVIEGTFNKLYEYDNPPTDQATITVIALDLDVDSDNNNGYDTPDMDLDEEEAQKDNTLGKIIKVYREDEDGDGVPNILDMDNGGDFVPLVLQSHPSAITAKYKFNIPSGIRLWTKDGDDERTNEFIRLGGDLIESDHEYSYSDLFTDGWSAGGQMTCQTLYIEGLQRGTQSISCEYILGNNSLYTETVKISVLDIVPLSNYDRDGDIDDDDLFRYSTNEVFRFWINDDDDDPDSEDSGDDNPNAGTPDYQEKITYTGGVNLVVENKIDGSRDLIDFFPVAIKGLDSTIEMSFLGYDYYLKHSDGDLNVLLYTGLEPNEANSYLYSTNFFDWMSNIPLTNINSEVCISDYLNSYTESGECVILVEGRGVTTAPLVFEIRKSSDGSVVYSSELKLELSSVEDMFYHKNLIGVVGGTGGVADRSSTSNGLPDNGKNFVFVHGYNVNGTDARGWASEFYKRMYWSGSNAKFHAISWYGYQTQWTAIHKTPNYHENVINALYTAPYLRTYINSLQGDVIIAGHSLGNMVVSSAIAQSDANVERYFMINAAVAMECYNPNQGKEWDMVNEYWGDYYFGQTNDFLFASEWYTLFNNNDARHDLSWRGFFTNMNNTTIYNMYSSGEDVLANIDYNQGSLADADGYSWGCQEKLKGIYPVGYVLGSQVGGWGANRDDYGTWTTNFLGEQKWTADLPYQVETINPTNLITEPFFNNRYISGLFSSNQAAAENYASVSNKYLLARAIPARTFAAGRNDVGGDTVDNNVNMNITHQDGWPRAAEDPEKPPKWKHSDIKNIGYLYNYKAYNYIVYMGEL